MTRAGLVIGLSCFMMAGNCTPPIPATLPPLPTVNPPVLGGIDVGGALDPVLGPIAEAMAVALADAVRGTLRALSDLVNAILDALSHLEQFKGENNQLWFLPDLTNPLGRWRPGLPVAVGAPVRLEVTSLVHSSDAPAATPHLEPTGMLADAVLTTNHVAGRAAAPGRATLTFSGAHPDVLHLDVVQPELAQMTDPWLHLGALLALGVGSGLAPFWPDIGQELTLAPGARMLLRPVLRAADGRELYFHAADFELGSHDDWLTEEWGMVGVILQARRRAGGDVTITMKHRGRRMGRLRVRTASPSAVETLQAETHGAGRFHWISVRALLPGGRVLHQAPLEWEWPEGLQRWDLAGAADPSLSRTDVALVYIPGDLPEAEEVRQVSVRLGPLRTSVDVTVPARTRRGSSAPPEQSSANQDSGCNGGGHPPSRGNPWWAWLLVAPWLWRVCQRHRRRDGRQSTPR